MDEGISRSAYSKGCVCKNDIQWGSVLKCAWISVR